VKEEGHIRYKAVYLALAINMEEQKELPMDCQDGRLQILANSVNRTQEQWTMPIRNRKATLSRFAIVFEGRIPTIKKSLWKYG